jgi:prepilin-type N-terminal cleavage/methylation domain-containing protein
MLLDGGCVDISSIMRNVRCIARSPAMTLVEVMIVVVVLAIAAVIAAPMFTQTDVTTLDAACKLLVADLQFAQMHALSHADTRCGLRIAGDNLSYSIVTNAAQPFNCAAAVPVTDIVRDEPYVTVWGSGRAPELGGVSVGGYALDGDTCIAFGSLGELDQSMAATITLRIGALTRTVSVDPISGAATIGP